MNYPVFTSVEIVNNSVVVEGYVGSAAGQTVFGGSTVELFYANNTPADQDGEIVAGDGFSVPHGEGAIYLGTLTAAADGTFSGTVPLTSAARSAWLSMAGHAPQVGDAITGTATLDGSTSEFGPNESVSSVTVVPVQPAQPVPVLGAFGIALLSLGLGIAGMVRRRTR